MISTNFEKRIKINQIIDNQIPEFILEESPKFLEFLRQYYISQEFEGGPIDIIENIDQYLNLDYLNEKLINQTIYLTEDITANSKSISVSSTRGFPSKYGLLKIGDEIITYEEIQNNTFLNCSRGFSGATSFTDNSEDLIFSSTEASSHLSGSIITNLSSLFLKEFYTKLKYLFAPGFENFEFTPDLNISNFISNIKSFYRTKGTDESIKILFKILFNEDAKIINLEDYLLKPSDAEYLRRNIVICDLITDGANPFKLVGQQIKSNDNTFSGPVSKVDISTKNNKTVYKIHLFYGYGDDDIVEGNFKITPKTKVTDFVSSGSSTITVDSTIGFEDSGEFVCDGQQITYQSKSVNQFYGCSGISRSINSGKDLYFKDYIVYGYENGDITKKVEFTVISSLYDVENIEKFNLLKAGDLIEMGEFGSNISSDVENKTIKEYAFNSLIYNIRSSYDVQSFSLGSPAINLYENPDDTSLKVNDFVDILLKDTEMVVLQNVVVNSIDQNQVVLDTPIEGILPYQKIAIRRKYQYASSSIVPLKYPNILSNVQNTYIYDNTMYIASNSLPSRQINLDVKESSKQIKNSLDSEEFFDGVLGGKYTVLSFDNDVPFLTGDVVKYFYTTESPINGLQNNSEFYVEVLPQKNKIRLYSAISFLPVKDFLRFDKNTDLGEHKFVLIQHASQILNPSNSLKSIPLDNSINPVSEKNVETEPGIIGSFIDGVDIINYKSTDKVYYGPLENVDVSNSGFNYDVINPPSVSVTAPNTGIGSTAKVNLIVSGNFVDVLVDPQQYGIERIISISAKGGNGKNAVFDPIVKKQYREISFNAQSLEFGGSVNYQNDSFIFKEPHGLDEHQKIVYNSNGNLGIGIGSFGGSNLDSGEYLVNGGIYYAKILNSTSISLFSTFSDATSGVNTVGLTTANTYGIHKFRLYDPIKVLSYVRVVNPGEGYTYKVLNVNPSGISTQTNIITFKDHNFNDGDLINYSYENEGIVGLTTSDKYYVLKINENQFQLSYGGAIDENESQITRIDYIKRKPVNINYVGNGYHTFSYPKITVEVAAEYAGISSDIKLTPIVRGSVTGAYLYDGGSDYGSTALNLNIKPLITINRGFGAQLKPLIIGGKVLSVQVQNKGSNYDKSIDLEVVGKGIGCKLRANVVDGLIDSVVVLNSGIGYDESTTINISTPGQGAVLVPTIRSLVVNDYYRYPGEFYLENKEKTGLTYGVNGYFSAREGVSFKDPNPNTLHSRIIGWAKDGNPIYGPFGYEDPSNFSSSIVRLISGYTLDPSKVYNRPNLDELPPGFFVDDYQYTDSGDLDEYNGRFSKTPEFPNGIYAYFCSTKLDVTTAAQTEIVPEFPYIIGNYYKSKPNDNFILDQNDDLDSNKFLRNTAPYRVNRRYSGNYFLPKNYGIKQRCEIKSVQTGAVENLEVQNSGQGYSVGDSIIFDNTSTNGSGASAIISSVFNDAKIVDINTSYLIYENAVFTWHNPSSIEVTILPSHNFSDQDNIEISGLSTSSIRNLNGNHKINVDVSSAVLLRDLDSASSVGVSTDIYLDRPLPNISIGSSISIGEEKFNILNIFENNILRCQRNQTGISHTAFSTVVEIPCKFKINLNSKNFTSENKSIVYFNPQISIGVGTADGLETLFTQYYADSSKKVSIPTRSIYLPNHPFETNDLIHLSVSPTSGSASLNVSNSSDSSEFTIPPDVNEGQELYVIKKSKDFIGIVTEVGLTTTTSGLYFVSNGSNRYDYKFERSQSIITGTCSKITTKITTDSPHRLQNGDTINLEITPQLNSGGITTSSPLKVKYNQNFDIMLFDAVGFSSAGISTTKNTITILDHTFYNGQKVFYNTENYVTGGISTGIYFVNKVDRNTIKLCESYDDSVSFPAQEMSISDVGGPEQELSKVNPQLIVIKNNNLSFDLSDSSLTGYNLGIFYDKQFNKNFVSTGSSSLFNVNNGGTVGVDGYLTINYDNSIPALYYSLTKDGYPIFSNESVTDYQIIFTESLYNSSKYVISGASSTSFYVSLKNIPESLTYTSSQTVDMRYHTDSKNAIGPINSIKVLNGGTGYLQLPRILGVDTSYSGNYAGSNAIISVQSESIGKFRSIEILNDGFDYPSDNTLRPVANLNKLLLLSDNEEITDIRVSYGGKNYLSLPNYVIINTLSRKVVDLGIIRISLNGSSIGSVNIISRPKNLSSAVHRLYTTNNSNGVTITGITTVINGIVHASVRTPPIYGFTVEPFVTGDYIFVEGVQKGPSEDEFGNVTFPGDGFNSSDHGYRFFRVVEFINDPGNAVLKYDISPYTFNPGIPVLSQTTYSTAINENNYPVFEITQTKSLFEEGEKLYLNNVPSDIEVKTVLYNSITVSNTLDNIKRFDIIRGTSSNSEAILSDVFDYSARFNYSSTGRTIIGWENDIGKLNYDTQSLPDNDYYQNLSYSIKSNVEYDKYAEPLNKLVHPIGTKNFGEIGFTSTSKTSIASTSSTLTTVLNLDNQERVDIIKNYDLALDYEPFSGSSSNIRLLNKKLSNYIECRSNRVLQIDDISNSFSSSEFNKDTFLEAVDYDISQFYAKFTVQVYNITEDEQDEKSYQISDLVILNDFKNTYTLNKSNIYTNFELGYFEGDLNNVGNPYLKFNPTDPYNTSYDLKIYADYFTLPNVTGFGITDYGFLRLFSEARTIKNEVGFTTSVFRALSSEYHTIHSSSLIINTDDYSLNYYEVVGTYTGNNTHLSEFYFDSSQYLGGFSAGYIGTFGLTEDSGILSLNFTNSTNNNVVIKTKTCAIGNTSLGIGTYRFLVEDQIEGSEKTVRIESEYLNITGITTIKTFDSSVESSLKSLIRVSIGSTVSIYQTLVISDQVTTKLQSDPFITVGTSVGLGTFSTQNDGSLVNILFHPDPDFSSSELLVQSVHNIFYSENDEFNIPEILSYGPSRERIYINKYGSINNYGKDRLDFDLNWNRLPIFEKKFNPKNTNQFNFSTGTFTIRNHFFEDNEELIYSPGSTLVGVAASSIGISTTVVGGTTFIGDSIVGFETITGIASTEGIIFTDPNVFYGVNIPDDSKIISIGQTYSYFVGSVSTNSNIITGIANTTILELGSGIFSIDGNVQYGTITSIGINSITSSEIIPDSNDTVYYSDNLNYSVTFNNVSTATTFRESYQVGIVTDLCPSIVYAKKIDENNFTITGTKSGIAFTFTNYGSGNVHKFEMKKKLEKTILTVNGVLQSPLTYTPLSKTLSGNLNGVVSTGTSFISLSGISSIQPIDILKIDDEYMTVIGVGLGTTQTGPINGIGTFPLCRVNRGALGSYESEHTDGANVRIYRGSYNIVGNKIWFSEAPDGKGNNALFADNYLPLPKSTFNGRVYLKKDYSINRIYDDISLQFSGIGRTFTLYTEGNLISDAQPGNSILLINDIFQTPDVNNNTGNNYELLTNDGISSVRFKGITLPNTSESFTVDYDVNQNDLPKGGVLVSLAYTGGYGYAPLFGVPSDVLDVKVGSGGSISHIGFTTSIIVGLAATGVIGVSTDIISGINTNSIKVNQKVMNILNKYVDDVSLIPQHVNLKVPNETNILQFDTLVTEILTDSIVISKLTTNTESLTTSFGFDFGDEFRGSGYYSSVSVAVTDGSHVGSAATIIAYVGSGGSITEFNIVNGGSGYSNPSVSISDPTYQNLPVTGIYRPSIGSTSETGIGLSITIEVSPSERVSGIESRSYYVSDFKITKPGYNFELGDVLTVSGLTTASGLSSPVEPIVFTVTEIKFDTFSSWQVGEFDFVDSIKSLQNGVRTRFPLVKDNVLLSFERSKTDPAASIIDFSTILLIFVNGVMQEPGVSYTYSGGTTIKFNEPPKYEDNISIFFYRGTAGVDSVELSVYPKIKPGDTVQIKKNNSLPLSVDQDPRVISYITSSDTFETGIYFGQGIDDTNLKPINIIPQKTDIVTNQITQFKDRDSLESLVFPTANIIKTVNSSDTEIFVDNAEFFNYEEDNSASIISSFDAFIIDPVTQVSAALTATVSSDSTISDINISDGGSGYVGIGNSILLKMNSTPGISTEAIIYATVSSAGTITSPFDIINPGYGYTTDNIPQIIAPIPPFGHEEIKNVRFVEGFSGIITGITTCDGIGTNLAIKFFTEYNQNSDIDTLKVGYPIYVFDTHVGNGVTSINSDGSSVISIGTTYCDNIYEIHSIVDLNLRGELICNVLDDLNYSGINTSGSEIKGRFSWGRFSNLNRSSTPLSIQLDGYTASSGLTTYPTIQRRGYGLRELGALLKVFLAE